MSKFDFTIKVLGEKLQEVGGGLYTLELVKGGKNGEGMATLLSGLMGGNDSQAHFDELIEAIQLLKNPPKS